jgi:hypothetical protein
VTLEELKAQCRQSTPELFQPGRKAELLELVESYIWKASWDGLITRHVYLQSVLAQTQIGTQPNADMGIVSVAHADLGGLFRQWRDELRGS